MRGSLEPACDGDPRRLEFSAVRPHLIEPTTDQILRYCAEAPIERVFLEDVARRAQGRFAALADGDDELTALCHLGSNVVPSGAGCGAFADLGGEVGCADADRRGTGRLRSLGGGAQEAAAAPRRPARPARLRDHRAAAGGRDRPAAGDRGRPRRPPPVVRRGPPRGARRRSAAPRPDGFRWRTRTQIEEGRSWLWVEDGVIRFKAEASAWTPAGRAAAAGVDRSARPPAGLCGPSAARPDPAAARGDADRVPVRAGRERAGDPALRVGRAWTTCSTTAPCCCERRVGRRARDADPRAPRARGLQCRGRRQRHPTGRGPLAAGRRGGARARRQLATEPIELGVSSRLRRASETLALALAGRDVPRVVEPRLDEIGFGSFEGGSLAAYRAWAWEHGPEAACPGGGETRAGAAAARSPTGSRRSSTGPSR